MAELNTMSLTSYNCKSLGEDKYKIVSNLIDNSTFVLLQEHWQYEKKFIEKVKGFKPNIECVVSSPMNENITQLGRNKGGVAIIWKSNIECNIKIIKCISKRLCAIKVIVDEFKFILFNVYMPTDPGNGNYDIAEYKEVLQEISVILLNSDTQVCILGGDWNSDISRNNVQTNTFLSFIEEESFSLCLNFEDTRVPYTFHNANSNSTIDHFLVTKNLTQYITRYELLFIVDNFSDHVPLKLELNVNINYFKEIPKSFVKSTAWQKCSMGQKQEFVNTVDRLLLQINIQQGAITCNTVNCNMHNDCIRKLYSDIIHFCSEGDKVLPKTSTNTRKNDIVAGWNEYVKEHKAEAFKHHQIWLDKGRPPQGEYAFNRRSARAKYHYAIRFVNNEKSRIRSNRMAEAIANNHNRNLWMEAKKMKQTNNSIPNIMDNVSGSDNINSLFEEKFKDLYNSVGFDKKKLESLRSKLDESIRNDHTDYKLKANYINCITVNDVKSAISKLKADKKEENGLNINHFKLDCNRLNIVISLLFNSMLVNGVAPDELLVGIMSPLIKDSRKSQQDSDNYRSLTIGTCISKIFDVIIMNKHSSIFHTSDNQFGFKEKLSTNMCTFALNETISYYTKNGSKVYALFLDASKAFDRLNYVKLFNKLLHKKMCPITIRLLLNMYLNQKLQVKWNGKLSQPFEVTNGVRQGGVLSPLFFSIYIDDLLLKLKNAGIGCHIGNYYFGALGYADDIVLLCPTKEGLRKMIRICETYAEEHDLIFNGNKSKLLVFGTVSEYVSKFYVNEIEVPLCNTALHLGNLISNNVHDTIDYGITKFNSSFNYFMSSFGKCHSSVKNKLFIQYCTSFYGSQIWPIYKKDINNKISIRWRMALRRIWNLPYNTHCDILPLLSSQVPIDIQLKCRFLKFYRSLLESDNKLIRYMSTFMTFSSNSVMGNNLNQILYDLDVDILELNTFSLNKIKKMYYSGWVSNVNYLYLVHSKYIYDLCLMKEKVFLNSRCVQECDFYIRFFSTL